MRSAVYLSVVLLSLAVPAPAQSGDEDIVWLDNYQAALKAARETGKPIFLEYRCEP